MVIEAVNPAESRSILEEIGRRVYPEALLQGLIRYWQRALSDSNPAFEHVEAQGFVQSTSQGSAHVIACHDRRLPDLGFVGFFESDPIDASPLLDKAQDWLRQRGLNRVVGPFDMTILQRYRFNSEDDQAFWGEPVNPARYERQFERAGFSALNQYVSGMRTDFNTILPYTKPDDAQSAFHIREIDMGSFEDELVLLHKLSLSTFTGTSEYFTEYSAEEFLYWYRPLKDGIDPRYVEFVYHGSQPAGFCYSFIQGSGLVMKSIGVLPEFQGAGASRNLIYSQHLKAQEDGLKSAIYALVRVGNVVEKMTYPGVDIFRSYRSMVRE